MKLRDEGEAPASDQVGQKPGSGKFRQDSDQPRPSERLRPDKEQAPPSGGAAPKNRKEARSDRRYETAGRRVERTGAKLDKARDKLAAQKPIKRPGPVKLVARAGKHELWKYAHGKIHDVERENVGVEAAHRAELTGEAIGRGTVRFVRHRVRTRPRRMVRKWQQKNSKARATHEMQRQAREHPDLNNNPVSRLWQKKRLQKQYQKQAREAAKRSAQASKQGAKAAKEAANAVKRLVQALFAAVKTHPVIFLGLAGAFLIFATLQACVGSAMVIGNGILSSLTGGASASGDTAISSMLEVYSEWETDLLLEAKEAADTYPGYDDYIFELDPVGTDPRELLAFLIVKSDSADDSALEPLLRDIFERQYTLTFTKTREDGDRILEVELLALPFADVLEDFLDEDELADWQTTLEMMQSGNMVGSPFLFDWTPYRTDGFGWRIHPITGEKDFHGAQDIAVPAGTEILAGGKGTVREAKSHSLYGYYVLIDYGKNLSARYSHCSKLLAKAGDTVQIGDVIALVGSTGASTGNHLDIEVILNGERVNPMYFLQIPYEKAMEAG